MTSAVKWTPEAVRALGVITDLPTALEIVGLGQTAGYSAAKRGDLPFPVLRLGRKYKVPVEGLLKALGLESDDQLDSMKKAPAGARTPLSRGLATEPATGTRATS